VPQGVVGAAAGLLPCRPCRGPGLDPPCQALDRQDRGTASAETTGLNFAILTATQKLGYAIPVGLTYPLLGLIGFDPTPGAANSASALQGLELLFALPSFMLCLAAARLVWQWPITAERHAEIRARLHPAG
jgi:glycoside/pentoside/hexuronide:cation symporter, GPH family